MIIFEENDLPVIILFEFYSSEEGGVRTASSDDTSPEVTAGNISRQAPIRQPVLRKRRLHH